MSEPADSDDRPNRPWTEKCPCGKRFMQPNSYTLHISCCRLFKNRLGQRLSDARKRRKETPHPQQPQPPEPNANLEATTSVPKLGGGWSRKRKPSWIDDDNLDVDMVHPSSSGVPGHGTSDLPLQAAPTLLANAMESEESNTTSHVELGRGHRTRLSYKIKRNTNLLPTPTLPISRVLSASDKLPQPPAIKHPSHPSQQEKNKAVASPSSSAVTKLRTPTNTFGLYKIFRLHGSKDIPHDPDNSTVTEDHRDEQILPSEDSEASLVPLKRVAQAQQSEFHPFPNLSSYRLGQWYWSDDSEKSRRSFQNLVAILGSEDFNPADVRDANWTQIDALLAGSAYDIDDMDSKEWVDDGISWKSISVTLDVPFSKNTGNPGTHPFTVDGFHYRPLVPILREKLESSSGREYFHTQGYELRWNPGPGKEHVRVYGEMYTSPAFLQAYEELQNSPQEPGCVLPRHIVGLMFASDSTMLASFGTAKLWPLYMLYANDSKYRRAKPTEKLFETVAYFEKLPDNFKDFLIKLSGKTTVNPALLTHCQRELFHEQWRHILDDEFVDAFCHGIIVKCYDGQERHFYPRIFTYSADYPEKILLASIKNLGGFPCPRCRVPMKDVPAMGKRRDRTNRIRTARNDDEERRAHVSKARSLIYEDHHPVNSTYVEAHMANGSLIPTNNAFSQRLSSRGFNLFRMLVVDLMHEVELGVWKALFIQMLRLLEASDKGTINMLDERYRAVPTFGRDTIRRFSNNVSEMKQLAARDWEDILQCSIPAFEGLLAPPHDARLRSLLFVFSRWHSLAKLRLHTDHTLAALDNLTTELGDKIRGFIDKTCSKFDTKELSREYQARKRREAKQKAKKGKEGQPGKAKGAPATKQRGGEGAPDGLQPSEGQGIEGGSQREPDIRPAKRRKTSNDRDPEPSTDTVGSADPAARQKKTLNLNTYKFHSLGDVVPSIRLFGTTDSYSTQMPERFHRYPKVHYKRTSKKNVSRQLSRIQMRQARIRKLRKQLLPDPDEGYQDEGAHAHPYFIGKSQNHPVNLPVFLRSTRDDPAAKDFLPKLRKHLLPRVYSSLLHEAEAVSGEDSDVARIQLLRSLVNSSYGDPNFVHTPEAASDVEQVYFHSDRLYEHNVLHINYTSYDIRRETDIVNPKTSRRNVMCLREVDEDGDATPSQAGQRHPTTSPSPRPPEHRFVHARVLGVFHANIVYRGRGSSDLRRRRFDFLFVRWFHFIESKPSQDSLDRLKLAPLSNPDAVGFLDPADVLRASHIIPRYSVGLVHPGCEGSHRLYPDKRGCDPIVSKQVRDWEDWTEYYVNQFVDRDMLVRHMWGHGVGHVYCHSDAPSAVVSPDAETADSTERSGPGLDLREDVDAIEDPERPDTLEDLENEELDIAYPSEGETLDEEGWIQDPDDELSGEERW